MAPPAASSGRRGLPRRHVRPGARALFPGLATFVTVLGFNLFGDGLRDALDPRLK
jgi:ABC-type dipeptide/oligopeptide/nickel transport system permease subunit